MRYLLDTNICIYIIKQKPLDVLGRFRACEVGDIGLSSITVAELQYGVSKSQAKERNQQALDLFLVAPVMAEFDYSAAFVYGQIRAELEQKGQPIGALDLLIAAQAISLNVILVTNNEREFARIPGLQVENWVMG